MAASGPSLLLTLLKIAGSDEHGKSYEGRYEGFKKHKEKKEVQKKLYDALYAIVEYPAAYRDLSMGIGKSLARILGGPDDTTFDKVDPKTDRQVETLRDVLITVVKEGVEDVQKEIEDEELA